MQGTNWKRFNILTKQKKHEEPRNCNSDLDKNDPKPEEDIEVKVQRE